MHAARYPARVGAGGVADWTSSYEVDYLMTLRCMRYEQSGLFTGYSLTLMWSATAFKARHVGNLIGGTNSASDSDIMPIRLVF